MAVKLKFQSPKTLSNEEILCDDGFLWTIDEIQMEIPPMTYSEYRYFVKKVKILGLAELLGFNLDEWNSQNKISIKHILENKLVTNTLSCESLAGLLVEISKKKNLSVIHNTLFASRITRWLSRTRHKHINQKLIAYIMNKSTLDDVVLILFHVLQGMVKTQKKLQALLKGKMVNPKQGWNKWSFSPVSPWESLRKKQSIRFPF